MNWAELAAAVPPTIAAVAALWQSRRNQGKIAGVHVLVNNRLSEVTERAEQLAQALRDAGIQVPDKPGGA